MAKNVSQKKTKTSVFDAENIAQRNHNSLILIKAANSTWKTEKQWFSMSNLSLKAVNSLFSARNTKIKT